MSLFFAELRKVWGSRVFPMLLAVLAAANLLLLWMGTRPTASQPPAAAWRAVGAELSGLTMEEKGEFLHGKLTEYESLLKIDYYYRQLAYGSLYMQSYRQDNAALFEQYEQEYRDKSYRLYTDDLNTDYRLFTQLASEYDTVAAYPEFLDGVQARAAQLAGISIFQNDETGYDMENIELTASVYAGLGDTPIDYYPQKGLYTAISYAFTDLILLAGMLLLALLLVRQERDSGLLGLVRSLPGGRLKTALSKLAAFGASLLAVLALLYGVNLVYCGASFGLGPLGRTIQSVPALMRCTMQITVGQYLFRFLLAKWAGAFVMGLWVMLAALAARRAAAGWAAALAVPLAMYGIRAAIPATARLNVVKYANQRAVGQLPQSLLVRPPHRAAAGGVDGGSFVRRGVFGGFLPGVCQSAAAAGGKAQLCAAAGAQNPPHHRPPGGSPQAAGDRRRGSVPGRVFGLWHLPGRDVRELHRRRGDLLRPLHERRLRPLHPR